MKTLRKTAKILSILLVLSLMLAMASCDLLSSLTSGSLKLTSFTVVRSSVKTTYLVGEPIDFSGIQAEVKYSDSSLDTVLKFADLTIEYPEDITATPGDKSVTVSFMDPNLNVKQETKVLIKVQEDPNAPKHKDYVIDTTGMKTSYLVGETLDFTGIKVTETFTNGGADVILDASKLEYVYDKDITATVGTKSVVVKYDGKDAGAIQITVKKLGVTGFELNTDGVTLSYMQGDTVDLSALTATVTYEDGSKQTVTSFTFDPALDTVTSAIGEKTVTVKCTDPVSGTELSGSVVIVVDGVEGYTLDTSNVNKEYFIDDTVSFAGIKVIAKYAFSADREVAFENLTFVHEDNITATAGQKTVTVKIGDTVIGEFQIAVGDVVARPVVDVSGADVSYRVGETVDLSGIAVDITYSDDSIAPTRVEFADITVITDLTGITREGSKNGKDVTIAIGYYDTVTESRLVSYVTIKVYSATYSIKSYPTKLEYYQGDTLDYTGLVVVATYADGDDSEITVDASRLTFADSTVTESWSPYPKGATVYADGVYAGAINFTVNKNEIASATVGGEYDYTYKVGDTVNFEGLTVTLVYLNGKEIVLTLDDLTVVTPDVSAEGVKTVTVSFTDPVNNESATTSFTVTVVGDAPNVTRFEKPMELVNFDTNNKSAGTSSSTDDNFYGQFLEGAKYVIGDDNEFKLIPRFSTRLGSVNESPTAYYMTVDISLNGTLLTKNVDAAKPTSVSYYNGETLIATVDTFYGLYQFTSAAAGSEVTISVLPSSEHYNLGDISAVVLTADVIDAYNVYEAWQLAVIDNNPYRNDWDVFKAEHGIADVNPAGIVFHKDIHISASDVPASFLDVTTTETVYKNSVTGKETTAPIGTRYLKDGTDVYNRKGSEDFTIQGNLFTLDVQKFPLVPSIAVFDPSLELDYGDDFSNSTLLIFDTNEDRYMTPPTDKAVNVVENLQIVGNSGRNNYVDAQGELASAGGLIFVKVRNYAEATFNNMIGNSFFIAYFPDAESDVKMTKIKFYDAYQNAMMLWGSAKCDVDTAYFNGAGGPLVICQSYNDEDEGFWRAPVLTSKNMYTETHLTGEEIWFTAVNATTIVGNIKAIGGGMYQAGLGNIVDASGNMNIIGLLMASGADANEIVGGVGAEGEMYINDKGIERWQDDPYWATIYNHPAFTQLAPFFTVKDAEGNLHTIFFNGTTFCDAYGNALGTDASHQALVAAFMQADRIVLSQGGLSVLFEFYHY